MKNWALALEEHFVTIFYSGEIGAYFNISDRIDDLLDDRFFSLSIFKVKDLWWSLSLDFEREEVNIIVREDAERSENKIDDVLDLRMNR